MPPVPKKQIKKLPVPALGPKQTLPQPQPAPGIRPQLPDKTVPSIRPQIPDKTASPIRQQLPNKPVSSQGAFSGPTLTHPPAPGPQPNYMNQPAPRSGPLTKTNIRQPQGGGLPGGRPSTGHGQGGTGGKFNLPGQGNGTFNKPGVGTGGTFSLNGQQVGTFNKPQTGPMSLQEKLDAYAAEQEALANDPIATDSIYGAETNNNLQGYNNQLAAYDLQQQQLADEYGNFNDPSSSSPYSRAAQLSAAWERDRRGIINSSAASGQLYSGAMQNADNYAQADYLSNRNAAENEQRQRLNEILAGRTGAAQDYANANLDAYKSFGDRYLESRPEDAPPPPAFVKEAKNLYKERLDALKAKRDDAENKGVRKKVTKKIKKIKKKLGSIPGQYEEV